MGSQIHRVVRAAEHDVGRGIFHGDCLLCGVSYPCEYVGTPLAESERDTLRAEVGRLRGWLARLEFSVDRRMFEDKEPLLFCPACDGTSRHGHKKACWLSAALSGGSDAEM